MPASAFSRLWRMYDPKALARVRELMSPAKTKKFMPLPRANPIYIYPQGPASRYALATGKGMVVGHVAVKVAKGTMNITEGGMAFGRLGMPAGTMRDVGRQLVGYNMPKVKQLRLTTTGRKWSASRLGYGKGAPTLGPQPPKPTRQRMRLNRAQGVMMPKIPGFGKSSASARLPTAAEMIANKWTLKTGQTRAVTYSKKLSRQDFRMLAWAIYDAARKGGYVGTRKQARIAGQIAHRIAQQNPKANERRIFDAMLTGKDLPTVTVEFGRGKGRKFNPFNFLPGAGV